MKATIKRGFAITGLFIAISCTKENVAVATHKTNQQNLAQTVMLNDNLTGNAVLVTIGTQVWMQRNLNVGFYRNGDKIPQVKDPEAWSKLTTGAWCWHENDSAAGAVYGKIYNWYAVHDPRGLAPKGFHIPSNEEWTVLTTFLGGEAIAGGKMKEPGTAHWLAPNTNATNSSGFTGLAAGNRYNNGSFLYFGMYGWGWSSTANNAGAWYLRLNYNDGSVCRGQADKRDGISVRCIKN
ncbi:MAG TPA: fibrobacter succinogenes major paralogous domain-containing protein [Panacibacter sp.]|nr:fibrobacter succinogenes major paralogous domain-containing protein [Panacibacter sp.]HNP45979.1 fibrobacter succinogenes major paralogous domain-containing protein [Panacibacter sp.]